MSFFDEVFKVVRTLYDKGLKLDLEDLLFPIGLGLLTSALPVLLAIYFNVVPYYLQFPLFVFSIIIVALSIVLVASHFIYTWPTEEPWQIHPYCYAERSSLEHSEKAESVKVTVPTREDLQQLKEVLGISQGSLQFKKQGFGVYRVVYDGKHHWKHVGSWIQLKEKLGEKNSSN